MRDAMSQEWYPPPPDWLGTAVAWAASVIAAGGAKPAFDWWRQRGQDRQAAKKEELDAAAELREELRKTVREMRADLEKRDDEVEAVRRELYEMLAKIAALTSENHIIRADGHRLRNWITVFYGDLQRRWAAAGLPMTEFPGLPQWVKNSPDGPTASFRDPT